jgi:hypothetical protein
MSPTSLASLPGEVSRGAEYGMRSAIRGELDRWTHPKVAEKMGLVAGATVILVGYSVQRRRARLERIEEKVAEVAEEVVDDHDER